MIRISTTPMASIFYCTCCAYSIAPAARRVLFVGSHMLASCASRSNSTSTTTNQQHHCRRRSMLRIQQQLYQSFLRSFQQRYCSYGSKVDIKAFSSKSRDDDSIPTRLSMGTTDTDEEGDHIQMQQQGEQHRISTIGRKRQHPDLLGHPPAEPHQRSSVTHVGGVTKGIRTPRDGNSHLSVHLPSDSIAHFQQQRNRTDKDNHRIIDNNKSMRTRTTMSRNKESSEELDVEDDTFKITSHLAAYWTKPSQRVNNSVAFQRILKSFQQSWEEESNRIMKQQQEQQIQEEQRQINQERSTWTTSSSTVDQVDEYKHDVSDYATSVSSMDNAEEFLGRFQAPSDKANFPTIETDHEASAEFPSRRRGQHVERVDVGLKHEGKQPKQERPHHATNNWIDEEGDRLVEWLQQPTMDETIRDSMNQSIVQEYSQFHDNEEQTQQKTGQSPGRNEDHDRPEPPWWVSRREAT